MAENPIHYDDFIANVQPDPAKPEATILLFGYVGHAADGEVRVYPDPTLGTWYDIPAADVVHSMPAPDAKLGGSYVWVRASAQIKPGSTAAAAAPDAGAAPAAAAAAAPGAQGGAVQGFSVVICAQPTPATHCFICPPQISPAFICPFSPPAVCHLPISPVVICNQPSPPVICNIVASPNCPGPGPGTPVQTPQFQQQAFAVQTQVNCIHRTFVDCTVIGCTQPNICTHQLGCQPQTHVFPCTETCVTLPINCLHPTQPNICTIVASPNCPGPGPGTPVQVGPQQQFAQAAGPQLQPTPTVQTRCFVCPPLTQQLGCQPQTHQFPCTETCNTLPVMCQPSVNVICPTPSAVHQCGQPSVNMICPTPSAVHQCGQPSVNVICPTPSAVHQCGQPSVNVICPTPSAVHQCGGNTVATVCQLSVQAICPTPSAVQQCGVFTPFGR